MEILQKLIYNGIEASKLKEQYISCLKVLKADVYFGTSLSADSNFPLRLLTSIESCKLRDTDTVFSFAMINKLLSSTITIDNSQLHSSIELEIYRLNDRGSIKVDPSKSVAEQILKNQADLNGLSIIAFEEVKLAQLSVYNLEIKLKDKRARQLKLKISRGLIFTYQ
ncbi:hypothetical protein FGO68_gene14310 [Halteria grandinella]|uniref:Uncharacterized protein n=1 Tax=Halteria grandinella TaxID=5974 RepID=A0A8J8SVS0_HALGN|nr:hypothetical protein FGO68_gene14310 [Halteria grandinella]